jgi:serine protease Do
MAYHGSKSLAVLLVAAGVALGQPDDARNPLTALSGSIRQLTNRVAPAVVELVINGYTAADDDSGQTSNQISRQRSSGSGVIVDSSGYIMTNAHLIRGAIKIEVLVADSTTRKGAGQNHPDRADRLDARILGIDRDSDLALIKIDRQNASALRFGDSDQLRQGDLVFAIGSPLGLRNSVSMGVVSAPARAINETNPILFVQTDASINPGNSGGALVDAHGLLVGLSTFIVSKSGGNEGIGFAIPASVVHNVYRQLRAKGKVSRGTIGVSVQNITPVPARGLELPLPSGVVVADVDSGSSADRAGLKRRDIILSVNGRDMESARQFENDINGRENGEKIALSVQRGTRPIALNFEVAEQAVSFDPLATLASPDTNLIRRLGILCIEIDQQVVKLMPDLRRQYGLIVAAKSPEGQAQFIDIEPGDVIHAINNLPVVSLGAFQNAVKEFQPGDAVVLQIERDGRFQYVAFEIE